MIYDYDTGKFVRYATAGEIATYGTLVHRRTGFVEPPPINGEQIADDLYGSIIIYC